MSTEYKKILTEENTAKEKTVSEEEETGDETVKSTASTDEEDTSESVNNEAEAEKVKEGVIDKERGGFNVQDDKAERNENFSRNDQRMNLGASKKKKRSRTILTTGQARVLKKFFANNCFPDTAIREELARTLKLATRSIQVWFQNQRQKSRIALGKAVDYGCQRRMYRDIKDNIWEGLDLLADTAVIIEGPFKSLNKEKQIKLVELLRKDFLENDKEYTLDDDIRAVRNDFINLRGFKNLEKGSGMLENQLREKKNSFSFIKKY